MSKYLDRLKTLNLEKGSLSQVSKVAKAPFDTFGLPQSGPANGFTPPRSRKMPPLPWPTIAPTHTPCRWFPHFFGSKGLHKLTDDPLCGYAVMIKPPAK
jgi:hypothetical protein